MLVKQYASLLTFVYLFKWIRRAGEKYGERMNDNNEAYVLEMFRKFLVCR